MWNVFQITNDVLGSRHAEDRVYCGWPWIFKSLTDALKACLSRAVRRAETADSVTDVTGCHHFEKIGFCSPRVFGIVRAKRDGTFR
jgi:hypothetical protein